VGEGDGIVEHGGDELVEEFELAGERHFPRREKISFSFLFERLGDVALAADGGLAADVVGGDEVEVGLGDLDVVAKIVCEADLQAADAGALLLGALEVGEPSLVVRSERTETVEFGVVAGADVVAVGEVVGEFVGERADEELAKRRELLELSAER
jgi:hypothetical protein